MHLVIVNPNTIHCVLLHLLGFLELVHALLVLGPGSFQVQVCSSRAEHVNLAHHLCHLVRQVLLLQLKLATLLRLVAELLQVLAQTLLALCKLPAIGLRQLELGLRNGYVLPDLGIDRP